MQNNQQKKREKARLESWTKDFDLCAVDEMEWPAPLKSIFTSEVWTDLTKKRRTLFRVISNKPDMMAFQRLKKIDSEMANILFSSMIEYTLYSQQKSGERRISLKEHFTDFIRTDEQKEAYQDYCNRIDSVVMLTDVMEVMIMEALELLHKIDPTVIVDEFKGVQNALKALTDFTSLHHKDEHNELTYEFCDFVESVQDWLVPKTHIFLKKYEEKAQKLINKGEIPQEKKKRNDRDFATETLTRYFFYNNTPYHNDFHKSKREAERYINTLNDEELKSALPYIITADREINRIAMAIDNLTTARKNMEKCEDKAFLSKLAMLTRIPEMSAKLSVENEIKRHLAS